MPCLWPDFPILSWKSVRLHPWLRYPVCALRVDPVVLVVSLGRSCLLLLCVGFWSNHLSRRLLMLRTRLKLVSCHHTLLLHVEGDESLQTVIVFFEKDSAQITYPLFCGIVLFLHGSPMRSMRNRIELIRRTEWNQNPFQMPPQLFMQQFLLEAHDPLTS